MMKQRTSQACSLKYSIKKDMLSVEGKLNLFNPICPGVFLSDHTPGGHAHSALPPFRVNPDRKMLLR